jgi:hypothetical protein
MPSKNCAASARRESVGLNKFPKGCHFYAAPHFQACEFDCPCTDENCKWTLVEQELADKLARLAELADCPVHVTSGFRCDHYQDVLRKRGYETAKGISSHMWGGAADIMTRKHTGKQLQALALQAGFVNIGVGQSWIHVDIRPGGPRSWSYLKRTPVPPT